MVVLLFLLNKQHTKAIGYFIVDELLGLRRFIPRLYINNSLLTFHLHLLELTDFKLPADNYNTAYSRLLISHFSSETDTHRPGSAGRTRTDRLKTKTNIFIDGRAHKRRQQERNNKRK